MDSPEQGSSGAHPLSTPQEPTTAQPAASSALASGAQGLTLEQVAAALGVSLMTVRRRVKSGALRAHRVQGKFGPEWRVQLEAPAVLRGEHQANGAPTIALTTGRNGAHPPPAIGAQTTAQSSAPSPDRGLIAALRDAQNTTAGLIAENKRLNDERAELYGRLGYLQAQLAAKDEQLKALTAPREPESPTSRWPEEPAPLEPLRPWWRFW